MPPLHLCSSKIQGNTPLFIVKNGHFLRGKNLARRCPIQALKLFDKMRLVVISPVEKCFVLPRLLLQWQRAQQGLKSDDFAECFRGIANVMVEQPPELPMAQAYVYLLFKGNNTRTFENGVECRIQPRVVGKFFCDNGIEKIRIQSREYCLLVQTLVETLLDKPRHSRHNSAQLFAPMAQLGSGYPKCLREHSGQKANADIMERSTQRKLGILVGHAHDKIFVWIGEVEKDINATIGYYAVEKGLV